MIAKCRIEKGNSKGRRILVRRGERDASFMITKTKLGKEIMPLARDIDWYKRISYFLVSFSLLVIV